MESPTVRGFWRKPRSRTRRLLLEARSCGFQEAPIRGDLTNSCQLTYLSSWIHYCTGRAHTLYIPAAVLALGALSKWNARRRATTRWSHNLLKNSRPRVPPPALGVLWSELTLTRFIGPGGFQARRIRINVHSLSSLILCGHRRAWTGILSFKQRSPHEPTR